MQETKAPTVMFKTTTTTVYCNDSNNKNENGSDSDNNNNIVIIIIIIIIIIIPCHSLFFSIFIITSGFFSPLLSGFCSSL